MSTSAVSPIATICLFTHRSTNEVSLAASSLSRGSNSDNVSLRPTDTYHNTLH